MVDRWNIGKAAFVGAGLGLLVGGYRLLAGLSGSPDWIEISGRLGGAMVGGAALCAAIVAVRNRVLAG